LLVIIQLAVFTVGAALAETKGKSVIELALAEALMSPIGLRWHSAGRDADNLQLTLYTVGAALAETKGQ
jgi:hypothetical protein